MPRRSAHSRALTAQWKKRRLLIDHKVHFEVETVLIQLVDNVVDRLFEEAEFVEGFELESVDEDGEEFEADTRDTFIAKEWRALLDSHLNIELERTKKDTLRRQKNRQKEKEKSFRTAAKLTNNSILKYVKSVPNEVIEIADNLDNIAAYSNDIDEDSDGEECHSDLKEREQLEIAFTCLIDIEAKNFKSTKVEKRFKEMSKYDYLRHLSIAKYYHELLQGNKKMEASLQVANSYFPRYDGKSNQYCSRMIRERGEEYLLSGKLKCNTNGNT